MLRTVTVQSVKAMKEIYGPAAWAAMKKNPSTSGQRWNLFSYLASSQGKQISPQDHDSLNTFGLSILSEVESGAKDPYQLGRELSDWMTPRYNSAYPGKFSAYLLMWLKINRIMVDDYPLNDELWGMIEVPKAHTEKDKGTLTKEGVVLLVNDSQDDYASLIETGCISGGRISEILNMEVRDINLEKVPDIPIGFLRKSKIDKPREFPFSRECYNLIVDNLGSRTTSPSDKIWTITTAAAKKHIWRQMKRLRLTKKVPWVQGGGEAWNVTPHNMRQFAENNIVKHWGDNEAPDVAKWLVGRKSALGSRSAYQTIEDIAPRWHEWVEPHTRWLEA